MAESAAADPRRRRVFGPARLGPLTLKNRIIKSATFEGASPRGEVTDELIAFHERVARGGVAMTTVAYLAVSPEGRTDRHCVLLGEESVPGLRRLTDAVHAAGALASAQIGHAGPGGQLEVERGPGAVAVPPVRRLGLAHPGGDGRRHRADHRGLPTGGGRGRRGRVRLHRDPPRPQLPAQLVPEPEAEPADRRVGRAAGGTGPGSPARWSPPSATGPVAGVAVTAKLNMADGVPGGFDLPESVEVARMLEDDGHLDALELTGGSSLSNPMYLFRGDAPRAEFAATLPQPMRLGFARGRPAVPEGVPVRGGLLPWPRPAGSSRPSTCRSILLGGVNRLDTVESALAEGFSFVAMARALLREPDLVARWERGERDDGLCIHCNRCMPSIYSGTTCVEAGPTAPG